MNKYLVLLKRENKLLVENSKSGHPEPILLKGVLGNCGYMLGKSLDGKISPDLELEILGNLKDTLEKEFGTGQIWKSVYFDPTQMPDQITQWADQMELYANPEETLKEIHGRQDIADQEFWCRNSYAGKNITLEIGSEEDLKKTLSYILLSPIPPSNEDALFLDWALSSGVELEWPSEIKCKEILCRCLAKGYGQSFVSGINDYLRVATWMSFGDATLKCKGLKMKLSGSKKKKIARMLESYLGGTEMKYRLWEALKYEKLWIHLAQRLHPTPTIYPNLFNFFGKLLSEDKSWRKERWEYRLDQAYHEDTLVNVIKLLSQREGEFLRKYDSLIRRSLANQDEESYKLVMDTVLSLKNVRPKTLLELHKYYDRRNMDVKRSYTTRSGVSKFYAPLDKLDEDVILLSQSILFSKMKQIWGKEKTWEGKRVYVGIPESTILPLSFSSGVTGSALPGTKVEFEKKGMMRFFCQWEDPEGKHDLDLHAILIKKDGAKDIVSFSTAFQTLDECVGHSGDIRYQCGSCAEYLSINFDLPGASDYKYALIDVTNYEHSELNGLENYVGIGRMVGDKMEVLDRVRVTVESKSMIGYVVDFEKGFIKYVLKGVDSGDAYYKLGESDIVSYLSDPSLSLRCALSEMIKAKGGEVIEELEGECEIISELSEELLSEILG